MSIVWWLLSHMIFNSPHMQLVMLMSWRTLLNLKMEISTFVKQNTEIFTHSSIPKLLNIYFLIKATTASYSFTYIRMKLNINVMQEQFHKSSPSDQLNKLRRIPYFVTLLCCLLRAFGTKIRSQFIPANRLRSWAVEAHAGNQSTSNNMQSTWNHVTLSKLKLGMISTIFLLYITFFRAWGFAFLIQFLICNAINSSSSIHKHWSTGVKEQPAWRGNEKEAVVVWHLQCVCAPTLCSKSPTSSAGIPALPACCVITSLIKDSNGMQISHC